MHRVLTHQEMQAQLKALTELRAACPVCKGDRSVCHNIDGSKGVDQDGLPVRPEGCVAFTPSGMVAASVREIRQPWQTAA